MNFIVVVSLITFLCVVEAKKIPANCDCTQPDCDPSCGCESTGLCNSPVTSPGSPLLACTFLQMFVLFAKTVCTVVYLVTDVGAFISCLAQLIPGPWGNVLEYMVNGAIQGGVLSTNACPVAYHIWDSEIDRYCPDLFQSTNNLVNSVLMQLT